MESALQAELRDKGFGVLPSAVSAARLGTLSAAYDRAMQQGLPPDLRTSRSGSDVRLAALFSCSAELDELYVLPPVLKACAQIIGPSFKLSSFGARSVLAGAQAQRLHVDVSRDDDAWPLVGFIVMLDEFRPDNGATRFVPGSHELTTPVEPDAHQVLACGESGSVIVYQGSVWHGFSANRSARARRSIQGAYIPRGGSAAVDWAARLDPLAVVRLSPTARNVLGLD